ncbi:FecR domain-containing protein [Asticcacaulis sp.]|uniref:FecR family protein n=1 Tax=Asticcacaulis sp. TaxID=1872648 RepID=UPI0031DD356C
MSAPSTAPADINATAARWVVRVHGDAQGLNDADILALTEWLEASDAHHAAFDQAERTWFAVTSPNLTSEITPETSAALETNKTTEVGVVVAFEANKARRKPAAFRDLGVWKPAVAAAALVFAIGVGWYMQSPVPWTDYVAPHDASRTVTLADGSTLHLNRDTRVRVALGAERLVQVDSGEVAFEVAHDPSKPFRVTAGEVEVRDIGTTFNMLRDAEHLTISVESGEVEVTEKDNPDTRLSAGDQIRVDERSGARTRVRIDPALVRSWQRGQAVFDQRPLGEAVAELNRYVDTPLRVADDAAGLKLTAVIPLDSEALIVDALQAYLPIDAKPYPDRIELHRRP